MNHTDTSTSQHGISSLRAVGKVNGSSVALLHAKGLEKVGETTGLKMEFLVSDMSNLIDFITFPNDGRLIPTSLQMTIDAIVGNIQLSIQKPGNVSFFKTTFSFQECQQKI
jgi:hypothetical protein